jgi:hypothetical protein
MPQRNLCVIGTAFERARRAGQFLSSWMAFARVVQLSKAKREVTGGKDEFGT